MGSSRSSARASDSGARLAAPQPGMTLDEWLTKIADKKTKRTEGRKHNRAATIKELEATLARVHGKRAPDEPAKPEEQGFETVAAQETPPAPEPPGAELAVCEAQPDEPAEPDQVAKIARAMNMIADWMDHVDERSVDTSRLVLQQQERTTRVLVSAVTSVSKRLTDMAQQIKVLEDRIAALTQPE